MEQRKHKRYPLQATAHITWMLETDLCEKTKGLTRDIGMGGVFIWTQGSPPLAASIHVEILLPKPHETARQLKLEGDGRVIRVEASRPSGTKCAFATALSTVTVRDEAGALMENGFLTLEASRGPVKGSVT